MWKKEWKYTQLSWYWTELELDDNRDGDRTEPDDTWLRQTVPLLTRGWLVNIFWSRMNIFLLSNFSAYRDRCYPQVLVLTPTVSDLESWLRMAPPHPFAHRLWLCNITYVRISKSLWLKGCVYSILHNSKFDFSVIYQTVHLLIGEWVIEIRHLEN